MSSEFFMFENSFFSDPFSPFADSNTDHHHHHHDNIFQNIPNNFNETISGLIQESPLDDTISLDQIASVLLSSSPPSHQLENLSLCNPTTTTHLPNATSSSDSVNGYAELSSLAVKTEEWNVPFDTIYGYDNSFVSPSCLGVDTCVNINAAKLMQRSFSSHSFDNKPGFLFQPRFDSLLESPNSQNNQVVGSPETSFSSSQMRKVCSTGDLHKMKTTPSGSILSSSPLSGERAFMEDGANNIKVGRYSAEERKERIDRYRAKRTQRNFNKTIKYACRKTLADTRPRIRGRFARNDEAGEIPKTTISNRYRFENEDDLWVDGFHEEDEEGSYRRASFFNSFNSTQYHHNHQYYSYGASFT